jgi:sec-independent protein translocase protein TatA
MGMPSLPELALILGICVLIFGSKRIRNLGTDIGAAVQGFKLGFSETGDLTKTFKKEQADINKIVRKAE